MITANDLVVSAQEVIEFMSLRDLSGSQLVAVEQIIAGVQGGLEDYLGRPVSIRQFTETARIENYEMGQLILQQSPVVSIVSRTAASTPNIIPGGVHAVDAIFGMPSDILGISGYYVVVYTAGLDGKNDESIRTKVMEVASRYISTHHDDVLSAATEVAGRPPLPASRFWTEDELVMFDRKRRRVMV